MSAGLPPSGISKTFLPIGRMQFHGCAGLSCPAMTDGLARRSAGGKWLWSLAVQVPSVVLWPLLTAPVAWHSVAFWPVAALGAVTLVLALAFGFPLAGCAQKASVASKPCRAPVNGCLPPKKTIPTKTISRDDNSTRKT